LLQNPFTGPPIAINNIKNGPLESSDQDCFNFSPHKFSLETDLLTNTMQNSINGLLGLTVNNGDVVIIDSSQEDLTKKFGKESLEDEFPFEDEFMDTLADLDDFDPYARFKDNQQEQATPKKIIKNIDIKSNVKKEALAQSNGKREALVLSIQPITVKKEALAQSNVKKDALAQPIQYISAKTKEPVEIKSIKTDHNHQSHISQFQPQLGSSPSPLNKHLPNANNVALNDLTRLYQEKKREIETITELLFDNYEGPDA
jgi:hypothetical protein